MYRDFDMPVVPLATNLGVFSARGEVRETCRNGDARLFSPPSPPACPRTNSLARLEAVIEARTAELVAEATGQPVTRRHADRRTR